MQQQILFYNISLDLWNLTKDLPDQMTDTDWEKALAGMEELSAKYRQLGQDEYDLAYASMLQMLNYLEKKQKAKLSVSLGS